MTVCEGCNLFNWALCIQPRCLWNIKDTEQSGIDEVHLNVSWFCAWTFNVAVAVYLEVFILYKFLHGTIRYCLFSSLKLYNSPMIRFYSQEFFKRWMMPLLLHHIQAHWWDCDTFTYGNWSWAWVCHLCHSYVVFLTSAVFLTILVL